MIKGSNFYEGMDNRKLENGVAFITSQRIIYVPTGSSKAFAIALHTCTKVTATKPWFKSDKIHFHLRDLKDDANINKPNGPSAQQLLTRVAPFSDPVLSISSGPSHDEEVNHALNAIKEAHSVWLTKNRPQPKPEEEPNTPSTLTHVGIGGLLQRRAEAEKEVDTALTQAFTDLDSLMSQAQTVTKMMDRLLSRAVDADNNSNPDNADKAKEDAALSDMLMSLGMASPVTRQSAGVQYHEQLARQLVDFLQEPLKKMHTLTLADVYCLYCRARGTALISPDDLVKATALWAPLGLPLRVKTCESGARLVQASDFNEDAVLNQIESYIKTKNSNGGSARVDAWGGRGVSALEISHGVKMSLQMTKEFLTELEMKRKTICRDTTSQTVFYYYNFFPSFAVKV